MTDYGPKWKYICHECDITYCKFCENDYTVCD